MRNTRDSDHFTSSFESGAVRINHLRCCDVRLPYPVLFVLPDGKSEEN